jgi:hypothetical protein
VRKELLNDDGCKTQWVQLTKFDTTTIEFHRLAYNAAFKAADLTIDGEPVVWSVEYYG